MRRGCLRYAGSPLFVLFAHFGPKIMAKKTNIHIFYKNNCNKMYKRACLLAYKLVQ